MSKDLLDNVKDGLTQVLNRDEIHRMNMPNYAQEDILIDRVSFEIDPYDSALKGNNILAKGDIRIPDNTSFPEAKWTHVSGTLLTVFITQVGKIAHNLCSPINGVGMVQCDLKITKQATFENLSFIAKSQIISRMGHVWSNTTWEFYNDKNEIFASAFTKSRGVQRDYSEVYKNRNIKQDRDKIVPLKIPYPTALSNANSL